MTVRKKIGAVAVNSGQLMVIDPCHIENYWVKKKESDKIEIRFWGPGKDSAKKALENRGFPVNESGSAYTVITCDPDTIFDLIDNSTNEKILSSHSGFGTYAHAYKATTSKDRAGEIPFTPGFAGLAVAIGTGVDGLYDVFGIYQDERLIKVEIQIREEK